MTPLARRVAPFRHEVLFQAVLDFASGRSPVTPELSANSVGARVRPLFHIF
jgi:hypothetical protein